MSLITSIEHAYAVGISDAKKAKAFVEGPLLAVLQKVHAEAPTIEAVTALVSPQLANLERTGDALLGIAIAAVEDESKAINPDGSINITVAASLVADLKAVAPLVKAAANTAAVAPAPAAKAA